VTLGAVCDLARAAHEAKMIIQAALRCIRAFPKTYVIARSASGLFERN